MLADAATLADQILDGYLTALLVLVVELGCGVVVMLS